MKEILGRLEIEDEDIVSKQILDRYMDKWYSYLSYVYFANIVSKKIFEKNKSDLDVSYFKELLLEWYKETQDEDIFAYYKKALLDSDFLLPDGIALQIFYLFARLLGKIKSKKYRLPNLNGTDFAPHFLDYLKDKIWYEKVKLVLYGTYPDLLDKTKIYLEKKWFEVIYAQDGYTNFDRNKFSKLDWLNQKWSVYVILVARSTPKYPVQEIRAYANKEMIEKFNLLVMNQGWTFDFRVWKQKRAPKIIRKIRLEWLYRLISDPKRNYKKVLDTLLLFKYIFVYLLLKK